MLRWKWAGPPADRLFGRSSDPCAQETNRAIRVVHKGIERQHRVARSSHALQAGAAGPEAARLLAIDEGVPVLMGQEVTYNTDDMPVLVSATTYRGDAYRFQADLYRPAGQTLRDGVTPEGARRPAAR